MRASLSHLRRPCLRVQVGIFVRPVSHVVLIADDLTGACDSGVSFHQKGLRTLVLLPSFKQLAPGQTLPPVLAFNAESRNCSQDDAVNKQNEAMQGASRLLDAGAEPLFYKKVDSQLRGHPAKELNAMLSASDSTWAVIAPALPSVGRTTVGGYCLQDGVPITHNQHEHLAPCQNAHLPTLLRDNGLKVAVVGLAEIALGVDKVASLMSTAAASGECVVCDACSDHDLSVIAEAANKVAIEIGSLPVLVGSAGLSKAVPTAFNISCAESQQAAATITPNSPPNASVLVVSGTSQKLTLQQIERLRKDEKVGTIGSSEAAAAPVLLVTHSTGSDAAALAVDEARSVLHSAGGDTIARTISGVVATGGETAMRLLDSLGAQSLEIISEVTPQVPLVQIQGGQCDGMALVTKSGALGDASALVDAVRAVRAVSTAALEPHDRDQLPLLGVTMGDPCGVGPEIIVKALMRKEPHSVARFVVIGSPECMERGLAAIPGSNLTVKEITNLEEASSDISVLNVWSPFDSNISDMPLGAVSAEAGRCATLWVREATRLAVEKQIDGIVTAPLNKEAMYKAGFTQYGGHTEILQEGSGAKSSSLCLYADGFVVAHATCHIPFREISNKLSPEIILETTRILRDFLLMARHGKEPRIAMAGLNPHCEPIFGDEETRCIQPAIDQARALGWDVHSAPVPPDTIFLRQKKGEWDAVVAMYHDQGHIPAKIAGFSDTVNVTLGLPIIRTSVDHGTAFDIAGTGIADEANLLSAIELGAVMAEGNRTAKVL